MGWFRKKSEETEAERKRREEEEEEELMMYEEEEGGKRMSNKWFDGVFGVVVGDALGCPVEFLDRAELQADPVTDMRGYGTFNLPAGSWTDDSSLTLALLDSLGENKKVALPDIMDKFTAWLFDGDYTPYGDTFDVGRGTEQAIYRYKWSKDVTACGGTSAHDNGNGSLMRIMPACLYCYEQEKARKMDRKTAIDMIHTVSALTHAHLRSKIACGLYYFMVVSILDGASNAPLMDLLQKGMTDGWAFYTEMGTNPAELSYYSHLLDLKYFAALSQNDIRSTGYVVDTLEAAVWSLLTTDSYESCALRAVNLGLDTDTVAAIAGGLAGLYYGMEQIPAKWLEVIARKDWIYNLCEKMVVRN